MICSHLKTVAGALLLACACSSQATALSTTPDKPQTVSISLGAEFSSGDYGTDTTTRSLYMPLIVTWSPTERFDLGIEVPFIYQNNANVTTDLFRNSQMSTAAAAGMARGGPGGSSGAGQNQLGGANRSDSSVSGLGDITLRFGIIAFFEGTVAPQIRPSLFIKCPTAREADGLGTGEFDAGAGVEITKWLGDVHLIGEGLYTYQGKVDGFGLKNYFSYTGGVGYQLTETVEPMVLVKGATAPSDYSSDLLEVRARLIWSLSRSTALDMYGSRGIADSSPEYGGGIAAIYSF